MGGAGRGETRQKSCKYINYNLPVEELSGSMGSEVGRCEVGDKRGRWF